MLLTRQTKDSFNPDWKLRKIKWYFEISYTALCSKTPAEKLYSRQFLYPGQTMVEIKKAFHANMEHENFPFCQERISERVWNLELFTPLDLKWFTIKTSNGLLLGLRFSFLFLPESGI